MWVRLNSGRTDISRLQIAGDDFDGDRPAKSRIRPPIHFAHSADADAGDGLRGITCDTHGSSDCGKTRQPEMSGASEDRVMIDRGRSLR